MREGKILGMKVRVRLAGCFICLPVFYLALVQHMGTLLGFTSYCFDLPFKCKLFIAPTPNVSILNNQDEEKDKKALFPNGKKKKKEKEFNIDHSITPTHGLTVFTDRLLGF